MGEVAKSSISFVDCQSFPFFTFIKGRVFHFNDNKQSLSATPCSAGLPRAWPVSAGHVLSRSKVLKLPCYAPDCH